MHPKKRLLANYLKMICPAFILAIMFAGVCHAKDLTPREKVAAGFFETKTYIFKHQRLPYRLLKPALFKKNIEYPLILFLHGSAERGGDNIKQLCYIAVPFSDYIIKKNHPCFMVVPQCPAGDNWVARENYFGGIRRSSRPTKPLQLSYDLLLSLEKKYPIDHRRIYVIGVSSGGSGTWDIITRHPNFFAAAAPFSGCGDPRQASLIARIPLWVFHGHLDLMVNPNTSQVMVKAVRAAGGDPRYTEYPKAAHNCWKEAFETPRFFNWLFRQKQRV